MSTYNCLSTEHSRNSAHGMTLTLPLVTQADITRVMGPFCHIVLDNGDEAFYINGHYIDGADAASREPSLLGPAQRTARAWGQSLRCMSLPVPDDREWSWSDITEQLARSAVTRELRGAVVATGCVTAQGRGVHFCNDPLLSGINCNLWFPVGDGEEWFAAIERILVMNGVAENLVRLDPLQDCREYTDWNVIYNRKVID